MNRRRLNQILNLLMKNLNYKKKIKWVYIYGHHRGGTTYMLNQYLKISKRGVGDWMFHESISTFLKMEKRKPYRRMNLNKLYRNFKNNILKSANIGSGFKYDIVIKQAVGTQSVDDSLKEINFFTKIFNSSPSEIIFMYREPNAWYKSAKIKFNHDENIMKSSYKKAFDSFFLVGGTTVQYEINAMTSFFSKKKYFKNIKVDKFIPKPIPDINIDKYYKLNFKKFINKIERTSQLFHNNLENVKTQDN